MSDLNKKHLVGLTLVIIAFILAGVFITQVPLADDTTQADSASQTATTGTNQIAGETSSNSKNQFQSVAPVSEAADDSSSSNQASQSKQPTNPLDQARERWERDFATTSEKIKGTENYRRATFYRAESFKYPNVRFDETFSENPDTNPEAKLLKKVAYVSDHILVRIEEGQKGLVEGILKAFPDLSIREELPTGNHLLIEFPVPDYELDYHAFWSSRFKNRGVYAEKDQIAYSAVTIPPFDREYADQWSLENTGQTGGTIDADIDAEQAWGIQTGSEDVIIAVLDTGVDLEHPDLMPNLWTTNTGNLTIQGFNTISNSFQPDDNDPEGHGTHCAGVIGASSNNSRNIAGINWDVSIMPVKVLNDEGLGTISQIVSGIDFATAYGARILNMSLGGITEGTNSAEDSLFVELREARDLGKGVLVIIAAGNDGQDLDISPDYPASYNLDNIISVAASDENDELAGFSNFGDVGVDIAAPGVGILSTLPEGANGEVDGSGTMDGTSMAAPHVAGVAGLIMAQDDSLTYQEIKELILGTADFPLALEGITASSGRLNAHNALSTFTGSYAVITSLTLRPLGGADNNGDEALTLGESMLVDVAIENLGVIAATNASLELQLVQGDTYATLTGPANVDLGNISAGASIYINEAFELSSGNFDAFDFDQEILIKVILNTDTSAHAKYAGYQIFREASLSGTVYDGVDGSTPLDGAKLQIVAQTEFDVFEWSITTGADGTYSIELVSGLVAVRVSAEGYVNSRTDIIDLSPANPHQVKDYQLGVGGFNVLTPLIDITVPAGESRSVNAQIKNTGTSPNPLFISMDYSQGDSVFTGDQLYGLAGVGSRTPQILLMDEFTFEVRETIDISLPLGKYAMDFAYANGLIWILAHSTNGVASVYSYDVEDWSPRSSVDLDVRNQDQIKSVEALMAISIPTPTEADPSATADVLAVVIAHRYYLERIYQVNPGAVELKDVTVDLGSLPVYFGGFWFYNERLAGTNAGSRNSFFIAEDYWINELELPEGDAGNDGGDGDGDGPETPTVQLVGEEIYLGSFQEYRYTYDEDFFFTYSVNFPFAQINSITYYDSNSSLYILTNAAFNNVIRVDWDEVEEISVFDKPRGMDRLTSSSSASNLSWLSLGYDTGNVGRGGIASVPVNINATDLTNDRLATIRVRSSLDGRPQYITVRVSIGDISTLLPGFVEWYQKHYLSDPESGDAMEDTDGDSIPTAIEYVVGGDPTVNDNAQGGMPRVVRAPGSDNVLMKFRKRIDLPEDILTIKGAENFSDPMVELVRGVDYQVVSTTPINSEIEEIVISTTFEDSGFFTLEINL